MAPRKGKYAHIIDKLPRLFGLDASYQERVDETIKALQAQAAETGLALDAAALAQLYADCRDEAELRERELHEVNLRVAATAQMLANEFDAQGISTLKLSSGASVQCYAEPHSVVTDKEAYRLWCLRNGYEQDMVLPWMKTNAIMRERLLEGEKEPDGVEAIGRPKIVYKAGA